MKLGVLLRSIFYSMRLLTQTGILLITTPIKRCEAKRSFKRQLIESGLSRVEAEEIAKAFPKAPSIRDLIGLLRSLEF